MSLWLSIYRAVLKAPLLLFTRSGSIPNDPIEELDLDLGRPIVYILPYRSQSDLLMLQQNAKKLGLPDPLSPLQINNVSMKRYIFIGKNPRRMSTRKEITRCYLNAISQLLKLHRENADLDVQLFPCSVLWGRKPSRESQHYQGLKSYSSIQKLWTILILGRDTVVRMSKPVSLRYMAENHGTDESIAHKLARVARIHFSRQKLAAEGPELPDRDHLIKRLLTSAEIQRVIAEEAKNKGIKESVVRQDAAKMIDEIASSFSYTMIRYGDRVLHWLWNRLYQGINVSHAENVRRLAQEGHEIVYVPCHRSHMDYLLLSYVLYHQGLVPPHIAAGINLNFFPAGFIFRHGGAFFIRRTFKGNKLYSTVFREYLAELFTKGYSVEYFSEGGRSRTGRLLQAKTGMVSMTVQAVLRGLQRPVTMVPVYIGYEHVMEVSTYTKELKGKKKEKENLGVVFRAAKKLRNFGQGYVNFGEPIHLNQFLSERVSDWHKDINPIAPQKPQWMNQVVVELAHKMMVNINAAAAVNALTLSGMAILCSHQRAMSREELVLQLDCYINLLRNVPYSKTVTVPSATAEKLVEHAIQLHKFEIEKDSVGEILSLDRRQSILMTYYRNNIVHLFMLPALIAHLIVFSRKIPLENLISDVNLLFPFIREELFINISDEMLETKILSYISELCEQDLILFDGKVIQPNKTRIRTLQMLGRTVTETLQRYALVFMILKAKPAITNSDLETESLRVAQRLSRLHNINAPEFYDKAVLSKFVENLKEGGYLYSGSDAEVLPEKTHNIIELLYSLVSPEVRFTVQAVMESE